EELPKLPIPDLANTLNNYLRCLETMLPPNEYEYTKQLCNEFQEKNGVGSRLQELLINYASRKVNWSNKFIMDVWFLSCPLPSVINSSGAKAMPKANFRSEKDTLK
ncbi:unnamed protein product, partial [Didymodactylos carnosus]